MLQSLFTLTESATLTLVVARGTVDGTLAVTVLPKPTTERKVDGKPVAAFERPLHFVGTPEDIEAAFGEQMQSFTEAYQGLTSTVTDACASIEASRKEAKEAAAASAKASKTAVVKAGGKPVVVASAKPTPVPVSQAGLFDDGRSHDASAELPSEVNEGADDDDALEIAT